jgi:hypothetical protein
VRVGASVSKVTFLFRGIAPPISLRRVLGNFGPLRALISNSRGLKVVRALNHLTLWGRKSLSSWLRPLLELWLSRADRKSC